MPSIDELPSNIQIVAPDGKPTTAFVFYLQSLQRSTEGGSTDLTAIQKELDDTQTGAGLNTGGNYVPSTTSNYINGATSLFTADLLLDSAIGDAYNFNYDIVDKTILIPYNQQMAIFGGINIEEALQIDGRLILEN